MVMDPRNKSLPVFTWTCQDANTIAMYGLSKSFNAQLKSRSSHVTNLIQLRSTLEQT